jgi:hypothetical protein
MFFPAAKILLRLALKFCQGLATVDATEQIRTGPCLKRNELIICYFRRSEYVKVPSARPVALPKAYAGIVW